MLAGGGHAAAPPRACVLCRAPAALYCRNDDAFLCSSCDLQVHGCSAVLAGHERVPCALLGGGAASCDSGSAATASVTPLDAALRAPFYDASAGLPLDAAEAVLVAALEAAAQYQASLAPAGGPAPAPPSPFAFLPKLQPPPALPHPAAGAPAASDDTRWDARAALGRAGSLDAMLMECLEGLIAGDQAPLSPFDFPAGPPAGTPLAPALRPPAAPQAAAPAGGGGDGPTHSSCSSGGGGPARAAAAAAGEPLQQRLLDSAKAAVAATVAAATAGTLSGGSPPPPPAEPAAAAAARPVGGGRAGPTQGQPGHPALPPSAPPHTWVPVITTGMGGRAASCGPPAPATATAAREPPADLWPQGSGTLPGPAPSAPPPPPALLRQRSPPLAALPPAAARLGSGGSVGGAAAVTTGAEAAGAALAAAATAKKDAAAEASRGHSRTPGVRRTQRASAAAAAAKTAAMAAAEAEAARGGEPTSLPARAAGDHSARSSDDGGIVVPPYREGESRADKLARYRAKKLRRQFQPTVRYQCRKHYADLRPRIRGRFVSPEEFAAWREQRGQLGGSPAAAAAPAAC